MINKDEFDFLGITKWHEAGYKGQGIKIASKENIKKDTFTDVHSNRFEDDNGRFSTHGTIVMDFIRQVAPESYKIASNVDGSIKKNILYSEGAEFLLHEQPDILTTSQWSSWDLKEPVQKVYQILNEQGTYFVCSAGNDGDLGATPLAKTGLWKAIGACRYNNGKIKRSSYSSIDEEVDYASFDHVEATIDGKCYNGTSFSAPIFAGMLALVQCFFLENIGRKLTNKELDAFVRQNCIDLGVDGKDSEFGNGLFVLPDPDKIGVNKMEIVLKIGDKKAFVNGKTIELDVPPKIENGRTLVPIRFVSETFGCDVKWDELERKITIIK